jgi:hypothetical protein
LTNQQNENIAVSDIKKENFKSSAISVPPIHYFVPNIELPLKDNGSINILISSNLAIERFIQ